MAQVPGTSVATHPGTAPVSPMLDAEGGVDLNIPVRVVYRPSDPADTTPFVMQYARVRYALQPNTPTFVPYLCMVLYMGDPRAVDVPGDNMHLKYRRLEVERLRAHWGVYEYDDRWAELPNLTAYPIDSDTPFNTVLDDPDGVNLDSAATPANESAYLREEVARLTRALGSIQARQEAAEQAEAARLAAFNSTEPLDQQMTMSRTVAPEEMVGAMTRPTTGSVLAGDGTVGPRTKGATTPPDTVTEDGPGTPI